MSRALIALCLALQAIPARFTPEAVALRASAPFEPSRREVALWSEGRQLATGTWLVDGRRSHVAFRNPLGQPTSILRVADGAVGLELVGVREVVAADASSVLGEASEGALDAEGLAALVLGRLPGPPDRIEAVGPGFLAWRGDLVAGLDREGRVRVARLGRLEVRHTADGVRLSDGVATFRVVLGEPERGPVPSHAFRIGAERAVPSISTARLGRLTARRMLGL
ncbi:MAG: hypothetical protein H6737_00455 [Alphaproteobacteria bacterium]|nr:hypothetical protein [Alphaproteobacteria bacterium]